MGKRKVIFYLIDGARPDVLNQLTSEGHLPNIQQHLMNEGSHVKGTTCFPSTTGPAYLPFLTGHYPGDHHITGIRWFDKNEFFKKGRWSRNSMRSYCGYEAKYFNDDMDPSMPSLFEEVDKGLNIYNMITKGVKEEFDLTKKGKTGLYFKAHFYHKHHEVDLAGHQKLMTGLDMDPDFIFAVFPSIDWDSHTYHYQDSRTIESYKIVDNSLGEVVAKLKQKNEYEDTLIVMASDHGLSSTHTHLDLGDFFKSRSYRVIEYPTIFSPKPKVSVTISGNSFASLCFLDNRNPYTYDRLIQDHSDVITDLLNQEAIDFALVKETDTAFMVINASGEARVIDYDRKKFSYVPLSGDPWGLKEEIIGEEDEAAYIRTFESDYPDCLLQSAQLMSSHRAGDLVISAKTGYDLRDFWEIPEHKGSHGSLHYEHMHVPILTNQPGILSRPIRTSHVHGIIKSWLSKSAK